MNGTINEYDRLQALSRISIFQNDVQKIKGELDWRRRERLESKFFDKYDVPFKDVEFIQKHGTVIPENSPEMEGLCKDILSIQSVAFLNTSASDFHFEQASLSSGKLVSQGKYIAVLVDLSQKKSKILSDFESFIESVVRQCVTVDTQYFEETRGTKKDFQYSIWYVYDLCSVGKKLNFTEVARKLSGKAGQARDNNQLAACLKAVKRAYKRAIQIMEFVEDEIRKKVDV